MQGLAHPSTGSPKYESMSELTNRLMLDVFTDSDVIEIRPNAMTSGPPVTQGVLSIRVGDDDPFAVHLGLGDLALEKTIHREEGGVQIPFAKIKIRIEDTQQDGKWNRRQRALGIFLCHRFKGDAFKGGEKRRIVAEYGTFNKEATGNEAQIVNCYNQIIKDVYKHTFEIARRFTDTSAIYALARRDVRALWRTRSRRSTDAGCIANNMKNKPLGTAKARTAIALGTNSATGTSDFPVLRACMSREARIAAATLASTPKNELTTKRKLELTHIKTTILSNLRTVASVADTQWRWMKFMRGKLCGHQPRLVGVSSRERTQVRHRA